jgi:hypothetical protein
MARARAAAEWAEEAVAEIAAAKPTAIPSIVAKSTAPMPVAKPMAPQPIAAKADPISMDAWPKTEPLNDMFDAAPPPVQVERVVRMAARPAARPTADLIATKPAAPAQPAPAARTVIPVPQLPQATDPSMIRPVIRSTTSMGAPKRYPRATGQVRETVRTHAVRPGNDDVTKPAIQLQAISASRPGNDDVTKPAIALPPASGARRVAAKHR